MQADNHVLALHGQSMIDLDLGLIRPSSRLAQMLNGCLNALLGDR